MLRDAEILKACRDRKIMNFEAFMEESSSRRSWKNQPVKSEPVVYRTTRSGKKRTNTESQVKKRKRRRKRSSLARPRFGTKGLEHVDVRVLSDKKSQDAIGRLLMEAQSHLKSILEGLRGFPIHNDRERIRSLLSKYRTKQIVLIRPKVKSSANDYVKPDVELQGLSREALHHVVEKVKTRYELDTQGFELETVSWVFVPPCAPPQSFHQDYEPSLIPSVRDANVEMGTILHLQAKSKSMLSSPSLSLHTTFRSLTPEHHTGTEFIEIDRESAKQYSLHTAQNVMEMIRQDKKGDVTFRSAVSRERVKTGTCVTFDTRWFHRGPSGIGYDETDDDAERSRLRRKYLSKSKYWRIVLHMSWKIKKPKEVKVTKGYRGRPGSVASSMGGGTSSMGGGTSSMGKIVFSPPNFLFSSEKESIEWLKGRCSE